MNNKLIQDFILEIKNYLARAFWFTPLNFKTEKEKFFTSQTYNPQFIYPPKNIELLQKYLEKLESLKFSTDNSIESYYWQRSKKEVILRLKLALGQGTYKFSNISKELYQVNFSKELLNQAKLDSKFSKSETDKNIFYSEQIKKRVEDYLANNNIENWQINIDTNRKDFTMRVVPNLKQIWIAKNLELNEIETKSLLIHELDGHLVRTINAHNQTNPILKKQFPFYLKTEEGLASYIEELYIKNKNYDLRKKALKYLGCFIASKSSFRETYNFFINNHYDKKDIENLSFKVTLRIKKGFSDTSKPGFFARELTYYQGMQEIKKYIDNNGDIKKLFSGKFGLADLEKIETCNNVIIPKQLIKC